MVVDFVTIFTKKSRFFRDRVPQARDRRRGRSAAPRAPRGTWGSAGPFARKIEVHFGRGTLPPQRYQEDPHRSRVASVRNNYSHLEGSHCYGDFWIHFHSR